MTTRPPTSSSIAMPLLKTSSPGQEPLGKMLPKRLTGQELFHIDGANTPATVCNFWSWAYSTLAANNLRGHLAEFIVASALGIANDKPRVEWDDCDLEANGLRIEVKSAAYLQSWEQHQPSTISFSIAPSYNWDENQKTRKKNPERNSDAYVFCLLTPRDKRELDPTNLSQWEFYVLPTKVLTAELPIQKTITLNALQALKPRRCNYCNLAETIALTHQDS